MVWVVDVEHVQRARAVVGDVYMLAVLGVLVDERRVHAGRDTIGELRDHLGVEWVLERREDHAVLAIRRPFARVHEELAVRCRHHVVHATRVGDE